MNSLSAIRLYRRGVWFVALVGLSTVGCSSSPQQIATPDLDPVAVAQNAMTAYDANGDKRLSRDELTPSPGLLSAIERFDQDGDAAISAEELQSSLEEFARQGASIVAVTCVVLHQNRPLAGATVAFVPEQFMGDAILPATGVTGEDGTTSPSIPEEELPEEYRGRLGGIHCGVYRVVVTHPTAKVPAKLGAQTSLGRLVTRRDHAMLTISF